ncbi:hypothetical protein [Clostridium sp.]|uniref:hypothetical protein n=1 Tax=Clostridium sp. TaxID=1506 RepID=UPI00262FD749|nr:hypothetical protein [Clostridium sp.]
MNTIALAEIFQTALDKQVVAAATTGWMEGNAGTVIYNGGKTIQIPAINMDGMGNYDRNNGYASGSVNMEYEQRTFTQDRGRSFSIDAQDVDETNFVATAGNVMSEFQRTKVIPEIDAYRYSTIASQAIATGNATGGYTPSIVDVFTHLREDIAVVQDIAGEIPLIISMSIPVKSMLEGSSELAKQLDLIDFASADGSLSLKVRSLDNCPIIGVPSSRMKTAYIFNDGITPGQEAGGFVPFGPASLTIGGVTYTASAVGAAGNNYTVTIVQGTGASVASSGVIDANGNLTITLGTNSSGSPIPVTASQICGLTFTGAGALLITASVFSGSTVQTPKTTTNLSGGAGVGSAAKSINWIITAQDAPIGISKTAKMRIFDPNINQDANAWKMDYRKYHDLWIGDNAMKKVFVNVKDSLN